MVSHGWKTYIQVCPEAELLSTMKPDWRFLKQVLRWTRNTWRSDIRSVFKERYIWTSHPFVAYSMVDKFINPLTLLVGPCLVLYLIVKSTKEVENGGYHLPAWNIILSYFVWIMATRTAKLLPHLWFRPQDIIYVPAFILFGYYFAIMKIYALFTLHETGWGTRAGIGEPEDANQPNVLIKNDGMELKEHSQFQGQNQANGNANGNGAWTSGADQHLNSENHLQSRNPNHQAYTPSPANSVSPLDHSGNGYGFPQGEGHGNHQDDNERFELRNIGQAH